MGYLVGGPFPPGTKVSGFLLFDSGNGNRATSHFKDNDGTEVAAVFEEMAAALLGRTPGEVE